MHTYDQQLELKTLSSTLKYTFLGRSNTFLVIIFSSLISTQEEKLMNILQLHKIVISRSLTNIKEVVKKEIMKWLDVRIIYAISNSHVTLQILFEVSSCNQHKYERLHAITTNY
ncbi:unnamed protein product [Spirodela intermedia]|uniref:Uncharacterized protein n=2 Tax=Spirodela intermedia TaxID=51605 RepID=A0A7I8KTC4_SPIIN|nr:unnamed protein product [Spirodela intermedia]CAA6663859.1 unnamed protein product [Spirodela intermedia]CAA7400358.1 unnamed protein product [Spirodela intermedia]